MLSWLSFLLPWDFSFVDLAVTLGAIALYARGVRRTRPGAMHTRPWAFYCGLLLLYAALQTRWDYYASHMFFVHRLQHFALHDVGPFLLCFAAPWSALMSGLPAPARRAAQSWRPAARVLGHILLEPWTATALFVGSLCLWVWPQVHFYAMLSNWLYNVMNWSVVLLDLPFWWLILDPRPHPQSRLGQGTRILMLVAVMAPMILVGAIINLARHDIYPVYNICGRFMPVAPIVDQQIGGLIIWIPGSMLATLAALIALRRAMHHSEARVAASLTPSARTAPAALPPARS